MSGIEQRTVRSVTFDDPHSYVAVEAMKENRSLAEPEKTFEI